MIKTKYLFLILCLLYSPLLYAEANKTQEVAKVGISQDEYNHKVNTAKWVFRSGIITLGVGGATFLGGLTYFIVKAKQNKNQSFGFLSGTPGTVAAFAGLALMPVGGGLMIGGSIAKKNVDKKYYVLSPVVSQNGFFGLSLSQKF